MTTPPGRILVAGAACVFLQATPAWLLASQSGDRVMTTPLAASLEGPLGLAGRQLLSATAPPFVAYVLSTSALCPMLLLLLWETHASAWPSLPRASRPARVQITWAVAHAVGLCGLVALLLLRAPSVQDVAGWSLRIGLWAASASITWLAALSVLSTMVQRTWLRILAWFAFAFVLLLCDTLWRAQPAPLLPPSVVRNLLAGERAGALVASCLWAAFALAFSGWVRRREGNATDGVAG